MQMYKVKDVYFDIINACVSICVEVFGDIIRGCLRFDAPEVSLESIHESQFRLTDILLITLLATDAIDQVTAFACNVGFCGVLSLRKVADNVSSLV